MERETKRMVFMNELCKLKSHMWFYTNRKEVEREDGLYSVATKKQCSRCGEIKRISLR
jgi:hypothetical protein